MDRGLKRSVSNNSQNQENNLNNSKRQETQNTQSSQVRCDTLQSSKQRIKKFEDSKQVSSNSMFKIEFNKYLKDKQVYSRKVSTVSPINEISKQKFGIIPKTPGQKSKNQPFFFQSHTEQKIPLEQSFNSENQIDQVIDSQNTTSYNKNKFINIKNEKFKINKQRNQIKNQKQDDYEQNQIIKAQTIYQTQNYHKKQHYISSLNISDFKSHTSSHFNSPQQNSITIVDQEQYQQQLQNQFKPNNKSLHIDLIKEKSIENTSRIQDQKQESNKKPSSTFGKFLNRRNSQKILDNGYLVKQENGDENNNINFQRFVAHDPKPKFNDVDQIVESLKVMLQQNQQQQKQQSNQDQNQKLLDNQNKQQHYKSQEKGDIQAINNFNSSVYSGNSYNFQKLAFKKQKIEENIDKVNKKQTQSRIKRLNIGNHDNSQQMPPLGIYNPDYEIKYPKSFQVTVQRTNTSGQGYFSDQFQQPAMVQSQVPQQKNIWFKQILTQTRAQIHAMATNFQQSFEFQKLKKKFKELDIERKKQQSQGIQNLDLQCESLQYLKNELDKLQSQRDKIKMRIIQEEDTYEKLYSKSIKAVKNNVEQERQKSLGKLLHPQGILQKKLVIENDTDISKTAKDLKKQLKLHKNIINQQKMNTFFTKSKI